MTEEFYEERQHLEIVGFRFAREKMKRQILWKSLLNTM
jgi:hypothetical protein